MLWKTGIDILHNIDDRKTAQKMKSAMEPLLKFTTYEKGKSRRVAVAGLMTLTIPIPMQLISHCLMMMRIV